MFRGSVLSLAVLLTLTAAPVAYARHADEWSGAKRTTHHHHYAHRRAAYGGYAQPGGGYAQPGGGYAQPGQERGRDVCRGDAIRLCKPVLGQGNMAVLGCFRSHANRLSRGCRALLASYGQL
jgi:hypothetical protein